uniref:Uncharacterized protein n=1 Tax=Romanomermis culicivorax TaxID=13658 RepID=A0A915KSD5_ROMCU
MNKWQEFKRFVLFKSLDKTWKDVLVECCKSSELYPNLTKLAKRLLSFNAKNAIVQCRFSNNERGGYNVANVTRQIETGKNYSFLVTAEELKEL